MVVPYEDDQELKVISTGTGSIISFAIEPGIGMRIIPISKARA